MRLEVLAHPLVQLVVAQRVARPRGHVEVGGLRRRWRVRGDGQHRVHDHVDRDDVDDALGDAGELGDLTQAVRADDRVGHLEPVDPTRKWV